MSNADYESAADPAVMPQQDLSRYTMIARFPDPATAAQAIDRIRQQGLAGDDLALLGNEGDIVHPGNAMTAPDHNAVSSSAKGSLWGILAGALIGAVVGVVVLALPPVQDAIGHVSAGGFIAAAIIGAIIGLTLGGLVWGVIGLDRSQAGVDSYGLNPSTGETLVGASASGERARVLSEALRNNGATQVQQGRPPAMRRAV